MPIYEYQCESCRHQLEALQKLSEAPLTRCPACGESALKKLMSASAFRLKGSGWYETDFKTGDKKNLAGDSDGKGAGDQSSGGAEGGKAQGAGSGEGKSGEGKASAGDAGKASASGSSSAGKASKASSASTTSTESK